MQLLLHWLSLLFVSKFSIFLSIICVVTNVWVLKNKKTKNMHSVNQKGNSQKFQIAVPIKHTHTHKERIRYQKLIHQTVVAMKMVAIL